MIFILLIPLFAYPILSILILLLRKPLEYLLIKISIPPHKAKIISTISAVLFTFPLHIHESGGYLPLDATFPLYFIAKEYVDGVGPGSEISIFYPSGILESGAKFWLYGASGILFQVLWLIISIILIRSLVTLNNQRKRR